MFVLQFWLIGFKLHLHNIHNFANINFNILKPFSKG